MSRRGPGAREAASSVAPIRHVLGLPASSPRGLRHPRFDARHHVRSSRVDLGRDDESQRRGGRRGGGRRGGTPGARGGRGSRGRARDHLGRAGRDPRAEERPSRHRRGDGRALVPARRARRAARGRPSRARRHRALPAGDRRRVATAARPWPAAPAGLRPRRRDGGTRADPRRGAVMSSRQRSPSLLDSFNYATEGVIHALRTQRNLWIHFAIAAGVLIAALAFGVERLELMVLLLAITFVLVAELVNTAIEAAVDVASTSFDPMAKLAKDIAAGAVLIAALNALAVGYLVFSGAVADRSSRFLDRLADVPEELTLVALAVTIIVVIAVKAITGRGTPLRGGLPSGHAAVAFAGWMAVTLVLDDTSHHFLVSTLTFIMALLVAQTRVESGVHSASEVATGGVLGRFTTLALFQACG